MNVPKNQREETFKHEYAIINMMFLWPMMFGVFALQNHFKSKGFGHP